MSDDVIARRHDVASSDAGNQKLTPAQRQLASSECHDALVEIKEREARGSKKLRTRVARQF